VVPEPHRLFGIAVGAVGDVPADAALLGDGVVGLDPQVRVHQLDHRPHTGTGALHQHQRRAGGDGDRSGAAVAGPGRRRELQCAVGLQPRQRLYQ